VDESRAAVEDAPEPEVCQKKCRRSSCGAGVQSRRTSPTRSLRGERDRSETKIRTAPRRLADEGLRWPGDGVTGVGGVDWIDRERHQYRSPGEPLDHGLVPGRDGSPPEGPLSLIPTRALHLFLRAEVGLLRRRSGASPPPKWDFSAAEVGLLMPPRVASSSTARRVSCGGRTRNCGRDGLRCGGRAGTRSMSKKFGENPCGAGVPGRRTSPTHSFGSAGSVGDEDLYSTSAACRRGVAVAR
jgi:hypothetical protein